MATQYEGKDEFPASFEIPDDNDDLDAASVNVALEALADRTAYLQKTLQVAGIDREEFIKVVRLPVVAQDDLATVVEGDASKSLGLNLPLGELHQGDVVVFDAMVYAQDTESAGRIQVALPGTPLPTVIAEGMVPQTSAGQTVVHGHYVEASASPVSRTLVLLGAHMTSEGSMTVLGPAIMRATIYRTNAQEP